MQVIFAVLIVHFFLKMTGAYGRNAMIAVAFVFALVMIGGLGYLVAYNNMAGATSATLEHPRADGASGAGSNSIDALFTPASATDPRASSPMTVSRWDCRNCRTLRSRTPIPGSGSPLPASYSSS
jgi:hypothetical protein